MENKNRRRSITTWRTLRDGVCGLPSQEGVNIFKFIITFLEGTTLSFSSSSSSTKLIISALLVVVVVVVVVVPVETPCGTLDDDSSDFGDSSEIIRVVVIVFGESSLSMMIVHVPRLK